jgi:cytochrome c oxidase subunit II
VFRHAAVPFVALLFGLVIAGCGDDDAPGAADAGSAVSTRGGSADHGDGDHGDPSPVPEGARHVPVAARSFAYEPAEIRVVVGEPIAIVLSSEDTLHDFVVDEVDAHVSAAAGETQVGGFRATEPGRYRYSCTVAGHREAGMEGTLVVEAAA